MEQDFPGDFQVNVTWFFASFSGVLDWIVLILVWFERSLHSTQDSEESCPWPLKLMTSQRAERTWIRTGGYGRFRGEWVNAFSFDKVHIFTRFGLAFTLQRSNEGLRERYRKGKIWLVRFWHLNPRGAIGGSWGGIQIYETSVQALSPPPHLFLSPPPASPGGLARKRNAGPRIP